MHIRGGESDETLVAWHGVIWALHHACVSQPAHFGIDVALDPHRLPHWRVSVELCSQDGLRKQERSVDAASFALQQVRMYLAVLVGRGATAWRMRSCPPTQVVSFRVILERLLVLEL